MKYLFVILISVLTQQVTCQTNISTEQSKCNLPELFIAVSEISNNQQEFHYDSILNHESIDTIVSKILYDSIKLLEKYADSSYIIALFNHRDVFILFVNLLNNSTSLKQYCLNECRYREIVLYPDEVSYFDCYYNEDNKCISYIFRNNTIIEKNFYEPFLFSTPERIKMTNDNLYQKKVVLRKQFISDGQGGFLEYFYD